jgi:hypothetical protein
MTKKNPWEGMGKSVERKIKNTNQKKIYWVTDIYGHYGISLRISTTFNDLDNLPKLRGIQLQKRNVGGDKGELNLILTNKNEWELFLALCNNLTSAALGFDTDEASVLAVENRLKRWQELLKKKRVSELSVERQMGLYTELKCLRDTIAPEVGFNMAIISWVGIDFDKQDFLLDDIAIEVKSHKSSKGEIVQISSKYQLDSIKNRVVLISYSLTFSEAGETVWDIVKDIREQLSFKDSHIVELFDTKLLEYGFIPELLEKPLQAFLVDNKKNYLVTKDFPKIESHTVSSLIQNVKYSIELTYCTKFEIREDQIF